MRKVIVFGTFDIIHPGHIHMLKEAKSYGDYLTVVIARDETVKRIKKITSVSNELKRLKNVKKLNIADKVVLGDIDDKHKRIMEEKPDIVALGYDQHVFADNLEEAASDNVSIIRLSPYMPEIYKSAKFRAGKSTMPEKKNK